MAREKLYPLRQSPSENESTFILRAISMDEIPNDIKEWVNPGNELNPASYCRNPKIVEHTDGRSKTYVIELGFVDTDCSTPYPPAVFIADVVDGEFAGVGEIAYGDSLSQLDTHDPYYDGKPHVVGQNTFSEDNLHRGLGERRYVLMNFVAKNVYGKPLYSRGPSPSATGLWEKLVKKGLAKEIKSKTKGARLFRFIK